MPDASNDRKRGDDPAKLLHVEIVQYDRFAQLDANPWKITRYRRATLTAGAFKIIWSPKRRLEVIFGDLLSISAGPCRAFYP
jgi:hypothetical protein